MKTYDQSLVKDKKYLEAEHRAQMIWMHLDVFSDAGPDKINCAKGLEDEMGSMDTCIEKIEKFIKLMEEIKLERNDEYDEHKRAKAEIFLINMHSVLECIGYAQGKLRFLIKMIEEYHDDESEEDISEENREKEINVFKKRIDRLSELREELINRAL